MGGVLVYVCGQEVLHGCCVEHNAARVAVVGDVDVVGKWDEFREMGKLKSGWLEEEEVLLPSRPEVLDPDLVK